jgi:hypothetical protein
MDDRLTVDAARTLGNVSLFPLLFQVVFVFLRNKTSLTDRIFHPHIHPKSNDNVNTWLDYFQYISFVEIGIKRSHIRVDGASSMV